MLQPTQHRPRHSTVTSGSIARAKKMGIMQNQHTEHPLKRKSTEWHALRQPEKGGKKEFWR